MSSAAKILARLSELQREFESALDHASEHAEDVDTKIIGRFDLTRGFLDESEGIVKEKINGRRVYQTKILSNSEEHQKLCNRSIQILIASIKTLKLKDATENSLKLLNIHKYSSIITDSSQRMAPPILRMAPLPKELPAFAIDKFFETLKGGRLHSFSPIHRDVSTIDIPLSTEDGSGGDQQIFMEPFDIAIHPITNLVYVSNKDNHTIDILNEDLKFIRSFGSNGSRPGQFNYPRGIDFSHDGEVLVVVDTINNRIQLFNQNETVEKVIGSQGSGDLQFHYPQSVTFDAMDDFYVSDQYNDRIHKYDREGNFLFYIGAKDSSHPVGRVDGLVVNEMNEVMALPVNSDTIRVYSVDGIHIRDIKVEKVGNATNYHSNYLARGPNGGFIVTDVASKLYIYTQAGQLLKTLELPVPIGVAFDTKGNMIVVSYLDHQLYVF